MSDRSEIVKSLQGSFVGIQNVSDIPGEAKRILSRRKLHFPYAGDAFANTNTGEVAIGQINSSEYSSGARVVALSIVLSSNLTSDNSNNTTLTFSKRTAGGAATVIATATTNVAGTGNLTRYTAIPLTIIGNAADCAANTVITMQSLKAGTGVALSAFDVDCILEAL